MRTPKVVVASLIVTQIALVLAGCGGSESDGTGAVSPSAGGASAGGSSFGGTGGTSAIAGHGGSNGATAGAAGHALGGSPAQGQGGSTAGTLGGPAGAGGSGAAAGHGNAGASGSAGAGLGGSQGGAAGASGGASGSQGGTGGTPSLSCDPANGSAGAPVACTPDEVTAAFQIMIVQPIIPPRFGAGIDMAGGSQWPGLSLKQAEGGYLREDFTYDDPPNFYPGGCTRLCQSTPVDPTMTGESYWGTNDEVDVEFTSTGIDYLFLNAGYLGTMEMDSRPGSAFGAHHYSIGVGQQVARDGQPMTFGWDNTTKADPASWANELYDAAIATYVPTLPPLPPGTTISPSGTPYPESCYLAGACVLNAFGNQPYFYALAASFGFVDNDTTAGPSGATPIDIQVIKSKTLGFSLADATLSLGAKGPSALAAPIGVIGATCSMKLGMSYGDFLANCVEISGVPNVDASELDKLLGGITRGSETYTFDVQGLSVNFHDDEVGQFGLIATDQLPVATDTSWDFTIDQSMLGKIVNDYENDDPTKSLDLHGTGLVYLEYARLVEAALQDARTDVCADAMSCPAGQAPRRSIGDPACLAGNVTVAAGVPTFARGCTGFEGFVVMSPIPQPTPTEPYLATVVLDAGTAELVNPAFAIGLKPGSPQAAFCLVFVSDSSAKCTSVNGGLGGGLFTTSLARVTTGLGHGDVTQLPAEARDPYFYSRLYGLALAKYMVATGNGTETPEAVHAAAIEPSEMIPQISGTEYATFLYVEHDSAAAGVAPLLFEVTVDPFNDIVNDYGFFKILRRSEDAEYSAMLDHDLASAVPGGAVGDDIALTNVFGSPLLNALYGAQPSCAITPDVSCVSGPPRDVGGAIVLDEAGKPVLTRYLPAIGTKGPLTLGSVGVTIESIFSSTTNGTPSNWAKVLLPERETPYDPKLFTPPSFERLVQQLDAQSVALVLPDATGQDVSSPATALDFGGWTTTTRVFYADDGGGPAGALLFSAADSTTFEGRVFLCQDPSTSEVLSAALGDRPEDMIDWMTAHPAASMTCGLVSRTTTSTQLIASRRWGVELRFVETVAPASRLAEVIVFNPALAP